MKPGVPWSVKGIDSDAREAAKAAARESGMTLGEWLNSVILDSAEEEEAQVVRKPARLKQASQPPRATAPARSQPARQHDTMHDQLEQLAEKLSLLTRDQQETAVNRFAPEDDFVRKADLDRIIDRIERGERRTGEALSALTDRLETVTAAPAAAAPQLPSRPEDVPGYTALESALRNIIDHMTVSERQTRESLQAMQARLGEMSAKASMATDSSLIEKSPAFASLERRLAELAGRIEHAEQANLHGLEEILNDRLGRFSEQIDAVRHSTDAIAQKAQSAAATQAQKESRQIEQRVEQLIAETRTLIEGSAGSSDDLQRIQAEIGSLNQRFDDIRSQTASERDLQGLKSAVEQMAVALDDGMQGSSQDFEQRLHDLHRLFEETAANTPAVSQVAELEQRIHQLDQQLAETLASQGDSTMLQGLEHELASITGRLQETESKLDHLDAIEKSIEQLFQSLESTREWSEKAAREAAEHAVATSRGKLDLSSSPEIRALEDGLAAVKASTATADERTQETLGAVHETLEQIIEKLTEIDAREQAARHAPAQAEAEHAYAAPEYDAGEPQHAEDKGQEAGYETQAPEDPFAEFGPAMATEDTTAAMPPAADPAPPQADTTVSAPPSPPSSNLTWQAIAQARLAMQKANQASLDQPVADSGSGHRDEPQFDQAAADFAAHEPTFADADQGEPEATFDAREDYIAAARRAAQSAAPRSASPVINGLNYMSRRIGDNGKSGNGERRKGRFSLPQLGWRKKSQAQPSAAPDDTSGGSSRKRLVLIGIVLLAAASAYAFNALGQRADKNVSLENQPALSQSSTGAGQVPAITPVARVSGQASNAAARLESASLGTGMPGTDALNAPDDSPQGADNVTTSSTDRIDVAAEGALLQRKMDAAGTPGATASIDKADPAGSLTGQPLQASARPTAELPDWVGTQALRDAAQKGDPAAQFVVASRFLSDKVGKVDFRQAATWYQKAAAQGLAPAQYRLGTLFERGKGVPQDITSARMWYQRAAEGGNVKAMHNLAVIYTNPAAGTPDYVKAGKWFGDASKYGLKDSMFNLAVLYERGLGIERDMAQAFYWFSLAARGGDKDAAAKSAELAKQVDADTLARITAEVATWSPQQPDRRGNLVAVSNPAWQAMPSAAKADAPQLPSGLSAADLIHRAQSLLNDLGYDAGPADGVMGSRTANAVRLFQLRSGIPINGMVSRDLVERLLAQSSSAAST